MPRTPDEDPFLMAAEQLGIFEGLRLHGFL
jgi:hypothetical protein